MCEQLLPLRLSFIPKQSAPAPLPALLLALRPASPAFARSSSSMLAWSPRAIRELRAALPGSRGGGRGRAAALAGRRAEREGAARAAVRCHDGCRAARRGRRPYTAMPLAPSSAKARSRSCPRACAPAVGTQAARNQRVLSRPPRNPVSNPLAQPKVRDRASEYRACALSRLRLVGCGDAAQVEVDRPQLVPAHRRSSVVLSGTQWLRPESTAHGSYTSGQ